MNEDRRNFSEAELEAVWQAVKVNHQTVKQVAAAIGVRKATVTQIIYWITAAMKKPNLKLGLNVNQVAKKLLAEGNSGLTVESQGNGKTDSVTRLEVAMANLQSEILNFIETQVDTKVKEKVEEK